MYHCGSSSVGCGVCCLPLDLQRELMCRWAAGIVVVASQRQEALRLLVGPLCGLDPASEEAGDVPVVVLREEQAVGRVSNKDDFVKEVGDGEGGRGFAGVDWYKKYSLPCFSADGGDHQKVYLFENPVYLFERIRHLVVNSVPALVRVETRDLGMMPVAWCA